LALEVGQAVTIVPAGADVNANSVPVAEGEAALIGIDATTKGDWQGRYGSEGWSLAGANPQLPPGVRVSYVGFKETFIAIEPTSKLAPQNPAAHKERLGVVKTAFLNGLIDVDLGRDHETEVVVYLANLDDRPRKTLVEALEPSTRKVLAATVVAAADYGAYVRFNVKGHVLLRVTKLLGLGGAASEAPMISGVLLGRAASEPPPWSLQLDPRDCKSGWHEARVDASVTGIPLSIGGTHFDCGVGTHAPSVWSASLRGSAANFRAKVGVQDGGRTVEFIIRGDGKTLFRSGVMKGGEKARDVNVSLKGIQSLSLEVTDGGDGNSGDHANWISPHIVPAAE
jgi:hypothetical protein